MAGRLLLVGELSDELTELRVTFEGIGLTVEMAPDGLAGLETGQRVSTRSRGDGNPHQ